MLEFTQTSLRTVEFGNDVQQDTPFAFVNSEGEPVKARCKMCWDFKEDVLGFMTWDNFCHHVNTNDEFAATVKAGMEKRLAKLKEKADSGKPSVTLKNDGETLDKAGTMIQVGMRLRRSVQILTEQQARDKHNPASEKEWAKKKDELAEVTDLPELGFTGVLFLRSGSLFRCS